MTPDELPLSERASRLIGNVFRASEEHDLDAFMELLTDDVELQIGSRAPVCGKASARKLAWVLLHSMRSVQHRLLHAWERGDTLAFQGEAVGVSQAGSRVKVTYVDSVEFKGDLVKHYYVNLDPTPLAIRPLAVGAVMLAGAASLATWALMKKR